MFRLSTAFPDEEGRRSVGRDAGRALDAELATCGSRPLGLVGGLGRLGWNRTLFARCDPVSVRRPCELDRRWARELEFPLRCPFVVEDAVCSSRREAIGRDASASPFAFRYPRNALFAFSMSLAARIISSMVECSAVIDRFFIIGSTMLRGSSFMSFLFVVYASGR